MSEISFPIKDLSRKKSQTILTVLGLVVSTAASVFIINFRSSLDFQISSISGNGQLTGGFANIFFQFILVLSFLNIIIGPIVTSYLIRLTMSDRIRDIGIMKASGGLSGTIFSIFFTQLSLLIFAGSIIGLFIGLGSYFVSVYLLNVLGFSVSYSLDVGWIVAVWLIIVLLTHFFGSIPIRKAAKAKPVELMSSVHRLGSSKDLGNRIPSFFGFSFRIVVQNFVRRISLTFQAIICLFLIVLLATISIAGGMIANQTSADYVRRAVGTDVIVIGYPTLVDRYVDLLSSFMETKNLSSVDFFDSNFFFSDALISEVSSISGILRVDPRLMFENVIQEVPGIILDPVEGDDAIIIGDIRSDEGLIFGVEPENVVNDWFIMGESFEDDSRGAVIIGDTLAVSMFFLPQNQSIKVLGDLVSSPKNYPIAGVCVDPLNNGKVVYMNINELSNELDLEGYNILFLKIDPFYGAQILLDLDQVVNKYNLKIVELNSVLYEQISFLNGLWTLVMILPFFSLIAGVIILFGYLMLSISDQKRDFGIMRILGAKKGKIMKIVFYEALIIILLSGLLGIASGLFISFNFLIPEPVFSLQTIFNFIGVLLLLFLVLSVSTIYPAVKTIKKSVISSIHTE